MPIYDYTVEFCKRCSPYQPNSPDIPSFPKLSSHRTLDQMVQAARSGMQNIPEGYKQQSLAGYIKLAGVARGSLEELLNDYLAYSRQNKLEVWDKNKSQREIRELSEIWAIINKTPTLPNSPNFPSLPKNPTQAINLLITLIKQSNYLIDKLIESLKQKHTQEGGFSENLLRKRLEYKRKY